VSVDPQTGKIIVADEILAERNPIIQLGKAKEDAGYTFRGEESVINEKDGTATITFSNRQKWPMFDCQHEFEDEEGGEDNSYSSEYKSEFDEVAIQTASTNVFSEEEHIGARGQQSLCTFWVYCQNY
jgi:hypothetical protein